MSSMCPVKHRKTPTCRAAATCFKQVKKKFLMGRVTLTAVMHFIPDYANYDDKMKIIYRNVY